MKALILAGGRGKRINTLTEGKSKSLIEINNKPLIEYNLDNALKLNIEEIVIVVGFCAEDIINRYGNNYKGVPIKYALQREQHGLVHAVETAKEMIGNADFFLMLADEIFKEPLLEEMYNEFKNKDLFVCCGVIKEEDKAKISKTYTILSGDGTRIFRLIEKPENALNNLQGTGHCFFKNETLSFIDKTPINAKRGEKELVDWIQVAVDSGKIVNYFELSDKYTNVNTEEDFEYAKKIINKEI